MTTIETTKEYEGRQLDGFHQELIKERDELEAKLQDASEELHSCQIDCGAAQNKLTQVEAERDRIDRQCTAYREEAEKWGKLHDKVEADAAAMREACGMNEEWPVFDVLDQLCFAVEHLVKVHDCDCHGHENYDWCLKYGRTQMNAIKAALATGSGQRLLDELATLRDTAKRRIELLRNLERVYCPVDIPDESEHFCPSCGYYQSQGHKPNCPLAAELKEGK